MTNNEEVAAYIEKVKENWPDSSSIEIMILTNLLLLIEVRCLLKGLVEKQRLGNWAGIAFEGTPE